MSILSPNKYLICTLQILTYITNIIDCMHYKEKEKQEIETQTAEKKRTNEYRHRIEKRIDLTFVECSKHFDASLHWRCLTDN